MAFSKQQINIFKQRIESLSKKKKKLLYLVLLIENVKFSIWQY